MQKITCLIVDDEPLARELISDHINNLSGWAIAGICKNALEAYELLMKEKIDVLFLDVKMPVISGLDFYRSLKAPPYLIFTTAYPEYAVEGFELDAVDYLVKPVTFKRFLKATDRIHDKIIKEQGTLKPMEKESPDYFFVKNFSKLVKVHFNEILFLEAQKAHVKIIAKEDELLTGMSMKEAEDILPATRFLRVHRSYIVSINAITAVYGNVIETGKYKIPVGAHYKEQVMKKISSI